MKPDFIARQSRLPRGWIGEIVARVMALETDPVNRRAVDRLDPTPDDDVLEIGCGHGRTVQKLLDRGARHVAAIDPSDVMVRLARRTLQRGIDAGRSEVHRSDAACLPFASQTFDAALAVHVVYFWPDPKIEFSEIRRVLRPRGRLLVGFRPRDAESTANLPASVYSLRTIGELEALLLGVGFRAVRGEQEQVGGHPIGWVLASV